MSNVTTIKFEFGVSDGDKTLQYFDFLAQALKEACNVDGVDRMLLCNLVGQLTDANKFGPVLRKGALGALNNVKQ